MPDDELLKIRNFGEKSLTELREKLAERGITAPQGDTPRAALGEGEAEGGVAVAEEVSSLSLEDLGELIGSTGGPAPMADADDNLDDDAAGSAEADDDVDDLDDEEDN